MQKVPTEGGVSGLELSPIHISAQVAKCQAHEWDQPCLHKFQSLEHIVTHGHTPRLAFLPVRHCASCSFHTHSPLSVSCMIYTAFK